MFKKFRISLLNKLEWWYPPHQSSGYTGLMNVNACSPHDIKVLTWAPPWVWQLRQDTSWMEMSLSFNHFLLAREECWKGTSLFIFVFIHLYAYYHNYWNSYYCHCLTLHNLEVCCVAFLDEYMISGFCFQGPISLFPESQADLWMGKDSLPYMTRLNGICWLSSGLQWGLMFWGCPGDLGNHSVIFPGDETRCTFSSM